MDKTDDGKPIIGLTEDGEPVVGIDPSGCPITGYDKDGEPILGKVNKDENNLPVHGYDKDGEPVKDCFDENGKPINGCDEEGRPIIGFKESGKPIVNKDEEEGVPHAYNLENMSIEKLSRLTNKINQVNDSIGCGQERKGSIENDQLKDTTRFDRDREWIDSFLSQKFNAQTENMKATLVHDTSEDQNNPIAT